MKKLLLLFVCCSVTAFVFGQDRRLKRAGGRGVDQNSNQQLGETGPTVIDDREKPPISDYNAISISGDTTAVDTSLTIEKDYKYNYLRKDNFELLPLSNIGQTFNQLAYNFSDVSLIPDIGARAKQYAFLGVDDIDYYRVPTPFTELLFKTTFEQGQLLDAFFTTNMSPRLNISIAYKGLRSLGTYQHILASQGSFRFTVNYGKEGDRYLLKTHFIAQDLNNEQNDGLTDLAQKQYQSNSGDYTDRSVLDVNFENAENLLLAKRFFLDQSYKIFKGTDSTANNQLKLSHRLNFTDKEYSYDQKTAFDGFGESYESKNLNNEVEYQTVSNALKLNYQNSVLGKLGFRVKHTHYNYGYNSKVILNNSTIPNRLKGDVVAVGGEYEKNIGGFQLKGDAMINLADDFSGNYLKAKAEYSLDSTRSVYAGLDINSRAPNFNFLLFQNDYVNYNWRNDFDNVQKQNLSFGMKAPEFGHLSASFSQINNYTYFGLEDGSDGQEAVVKPFQDNGSVSYLKLKARKQFDLGHFHLDNTVMYQNVIKGQDVLNVPDFVTRQALFYDDFWFDKALYVQTGFMFNYFNSYKANSYDPVLGEFYVQNNQNLDGFYTADFFFNGKVDTARLFFKLENFPTIFKGNDSYAAPGQPYRDFAIRFGIVWNFFL